MKNQIIIALGIGLPLTPLLFRAIAPDLYMRVWCNYPEVAVLIVMLINSICVGIVVAISLLSARLLYYFRNRGQRSYRQEKLPNLNSRVSNYYKQPS